MSSGIMTAFWGMTINNYDDTDLALVQNGYPDYCREIVHTLEEGKERGTPHIQAWIKLQRQQRLSFVKKLFPRGSFKPLTSDEYIAHTKVYAQKLDDTAVAAAVHRFNDPLHTIESVIRRVVSYMLYADPDNVPDHTRFSQLERRRVQVEYEMVIEDYRFAKIFVFSTYKSMWKSFGAAMFENIWHKLEDTHTHTHSDKKFSREGGITDDDGTERDDEISGEDSQESSEGECEDGEDYEDSEGETDEGHTEGECDGTSEEDDR